MKKTIMKYLFGDEQPPVENKTDDKLNGKTNSSSSSSSTSKVTAQTSSSTPTPGSMSKSKQKRIQRENKRNQKQQQTQQEKQSKQSTTKSQPKQNSAQNEPNVPNPSKPEEPKSQISPKEPKVGEPPKVNPKNSFNTSNQRKPPTESKQTSQSLKHAKQSETPKPNSNNNNKKQNNNNKASQNQKNNQEPVKPITKTQLEIDLEKQPENNNNTLNLLETDLEFIDGAKSKDDKTASSKVDKNDDKLGNFKNMSKKKKKKAEELLIAFSDHEEEEDDEADDQDDGESEDNDNHEDMDDKNSDENESEMEQDDESPETSSVSSMDVDQFSEEEEDDEIHVSDYDQESNDSEDAKLPTFNILLLGETGAGKSTTINAFANYLRYASFDDAIDSKFTQLIPSKFVLPNPETGEPFVIQSGSDDNECQVNDGNSNTQSPMGYTFRTRNQMIRIIDTPGMGDTRGVEIDKKNFDKILSYLNYHKELHGICILIKSNETRKTASFRYCISELLTHLHKSACKNIVFCFTFGRNSFYGPGEGFAILRGFLKNELKEANLELKTGVNCFFIDNEAYRFLVAKKQGYPFPDYQENLYRESWNKSVRQTQTMIGKLIKLEPHNLRQTTSLNHARKLIMELAEPMVQLQKVIHQNIEKIKVYDKKLKQSSRSKSEMLPNLSLEVDELQMRPLEDPKTVCTTKRCTDVMDVNGQQQILYKTVCHDKCFLQGIQSNTVGHAILESCAVMDKTTTLCRECGCQWQKHMHLSFEYVRIQRTIVDENLQHQIFNAENCITDSKKALEVLRKVVKEFTGELKVIRNVAAKFGHMLNENSNTSFNKFIEPYVDKLIQEEQKMLVAVKGYPRTNLELLETIKEQHEQDVLKLIDAIFNETQEDVNLEDIPRLRAELFRLKHTGQQFKQMLHCAGLTQEQAFTFQEKVGLKFNEDEDNEEEKEKVEDENDI